MLFYLAILVIGAIGSVLFMFIGVPVLCSYWVTTHYLKEYTSNLRSFKNVLIVSLGVVLAFLVGLVLNFVVIPIGVVISIPVLLVMLVWETCLKRRSGDDRSMRRMLAQRISVTQV